MSASLFLRPGMARSAVTGAIPVHVVVADDLAVQVHCWPGKGNS